MQDQGAQRGADIGGEADRLSQWSQCTQTRPPAELEAGIGVPRDRGGMDK